MFRRSLIRDILITLAFKAAALCALYFLFFGSATRPDVTTDAVSRALLTVPAAGQGD